MEKEGGISFILPQIPILYLMVQYLICRLWGLRVLYHHFAGKPTTLAGVRFLELLVEDEMAFDNLFCVTFQMMDAQWLAKGASYMEFNVRGLPLLSHFVTFCNRNYLWVEVKFWIWIHIYSFRMSWNLQEHSWNGSSGWKTSLPLRICLHITC